MGRWRCAGPWAPCRYQPRPGSCAPAGCPWRWWTPPHGTRSRAAPQTPRTLECWLHSGAWPRPQGLGPRWWRLWMPWFGPAPQYPELLFCHSFPTKPWCWRRPRLPTLASCHWGGSLWRHGTCRWRASYSEGRQSQWSFCRGGWIWTWLHAAYRSCPGGYRISWALGTACGTSEHLGWVTDGPMRLEFMGWLGTQCGGAGAWSVFEAGFPCLHFMPGGLSWWGFWQFRWASWRAVKLRSSWGQAFHGLRLWLGRSAGASGSR